MKTIQVILSAGLAGGLFATATAQNNPITNKLPAPGVTQISVGAQTAPPADPPQDAPPPDDSKTAPDEKPAPPDSTDGPPLNQVGTTNTFVDPATGELKLRLQFQNASLDTVLHYLSNVAGYIIQETVKPTGKVTVWSDQPVNKKEALDLVERVLNENGFTAIPEGRVLKIVSNQEAKRDNIRVILGNIPTNIPVNAEIVTQILPVRSLNAVSLTKDLQPLLPADSTLVANESGNSLIMTDTQANIHRIAEIVRALDSVNASSATIMVFPLKFADAKATAALIKDLFPSTTTGTTAGGNNNMGPFGRFMRGGGGGFPGASGGGGDAQNDTGAGHTPTSRITAVSDDHANALVVSVPDDLVSTIKQLVQSLDTDVQDTTEMRRFVLKHSDPIELATELSQLFPDESKGDDNSQFSGRFRFGFFGGPQQQQSTAGSGDSDRVKRLNRVLAVADPRTRSLTITSSKDMMPQIATLITQLDDDTRNIMHVYVMDLKNAEVTDVLPVLQDLFPSGNKSSSTSINTPQNSMLYQRSTTLTGSFNSAVASFGSSTSSGSRPTGGQ